MNPAEAMSRRSSCWNSMIVQGPPKERSSRSCKRCSSIFGQMWLSTTGPLISVTVLFAEECLRVIAESRRSCTFFMCFLTCLHFRFLDLRRVSSVHPGVDYQFSLFWICRGRCWHYPGFRKRIDCITFLFRVCGHPDASLLFQGFVLRSFLEFGSRISLLRFALLQDSLRWTENLTV